MIKNLLVVMTLIAVVSDYMLHPFYPKFFAARFGITAPEWTGYYFSAMCFMVMISFPLWALLSKKISELNILIFTQCIAGILAVCCYFTDSFISFWILSLIMILFKASYLLVYPLILKIISKEQHSRTIGLLSVVVHLGGILGAVIGGFTVDLIDVGYAYLIMALGDFMQMGLSIYLQNRKENLDTIFDDEPQKETEPFFGKHGFILKLGLVTLILYFSDFLIRPFFVSYWEKVTLNSSALLSGIIYAIPGCIALFILVLDYFKRNVCYKIKHILFILGIGCIGLILQGIENPTVIIMGRVLYGWSIFRGMVRFDVILFEQSSTSNYALAYSKVHFFQNLGVLLSSFGIGMWVDYLGLKIQFHTAAIGFISTIVCYWIFFQSSILKKKTSLLNT